MVCLRNISLNTLIKEMMMIAMMMMMMMMMIIIIIIATYQGNMKSRSYRKQPYWALHTFFGNY